MFVYIWYLLAKMSACSSSVSTSSNIINELHDLVIDKIMDITPIIHEEIHKYSWSQQIHILETYYVENAEDPVMKLVLPTLFDLFVKSPHKQVCEYIVYNLPLLNVKIIKKFINLNDGNRAIQWKVDFAKDWVEIFDEENTGKNEDLDVETEEDVSDAESEEQLNDGETEEDDDE